MLKKKKICEDCLNECYYWKGKKCKSCSSKSNPSKPIKKKAISKKLTPKGEKLKEEKKKYTLKQWEMFLEIWNERERISEISEKPLYEPISSVYFHHILPKNSYKYAALDKENIILLTFEEHTQVEANPTKFEIVNKKREELKKKYE